MDNANKTLDINTENYKVINGDVTAEQINEWKNRNGRIHEVEVADTIYKMQAIGELQNIFGKCVSKLKNL